jgi:hypothetical protein
MMIEPDLHDLVRTRAYFLWIEEGRPEGRDVAHWHRAVELVASEGAYPNATVVATATGGRKAPAARKARSKAGKKAPSTD